MTFVFDIAYIMRESATLIAVNMTIVCVAWPGRLSLVPSFPLNPGR
jgi:hypothetical protein